MRRSESLLKNQRQVERDTVSHSKEQGRKSREDEGGIALKKKEKWMNSSMRVDKATMTATRTRSLTSIIRRLSSRSSCRAVRKGCNGLENL